MFLLCMVFFHATSYADGFDERRVAVGLKLFRTLVNADEYLEQKRADDGTLTLLVVHANNPLQAQNVATSLQQIVSKNNKLNQQVKIMSLQELGAEKSHLAAIFVAQTLTDDEIANLVKIGVERQLIVFSPYDGDVERGVLAGLSVQANVRPLLNKHTLTRSELAIKPFYLKVAKLYE